MSNGIGSGDVNLFKSRALLFQLNPETRNTWLPKGDKPINLSFVASIGSKQYAGGGVTGPASAKRELKIVGTNEHGEVVLDAVILPNTNFDKRAPKFGQWIDHTRTLYGLGFDSEPELDEFMSTFKTLQQNILTLPLTIPLGGTSSRHSNAGSTQHLNNNTSGGSNTLGRNSNMNSISNLQNNNSLSSNMHGSMSNHNISPTSETSNKQQPISGLNGSMRPATGMLQSEKEQLKHALEESLKNAQAYYDELQILKFNNDKLTQALDDSKKNVCEWERELNDLRTENKQLKMHIDSLKSSLDMDKDEVDEYKEGCMKYKSLAQDFQSKFQDKSAEVEDLRKELQEIRFGGGGSDQRHNSTGGSDHLEMAYHKQELNRINTKLEAKVRELEDIQAELAQLTTTGGGINTEQS